jgi:hypothetical protein
MGSSAPERRSALAPRRRPVTKRRPGQRRGWGSVLGSPWQRVRVGLACVIAPKRRLRALCGEVRWHASRGGAHASSHGYQRGSVWLSVFAAQVDPREALRELLTPLPPGAAQPSGGEAADWAGGSRAPLLVSWRLTLRSWGSTACACNATACAAVPSRGARLDRLPRQWPVAAEWKQGSHEMLAVLAAAHEHVAALLRSAVSAGPRPCQHGQHVLHQLDHAGERRTQHTATPHVASRVSPQAASRRCLQAPDSLWPAVSSSRPRLRVAQPRPSPPRCGHRHSRPNVTPTPLGSHGLRLLRGRPGATARRRARA